MRMITRISSILVLFLLCSTPSFAQSFANPGAAVIHLEDLECGNVFVLFSPNGHTDDSIISWCNKATKTIDVAIYGFTNKEIEASLSAARKRGVTVRVVYDKGQAKASGSMWPKLKQDSIDVVLLAGYGPYGVNHNKFLIVDSTHVEMGSYNWSYNAERNNYENALFFWDKEFALTYLKYFQMMYDKGTKGTK